MMSRFLAMTVTLTAFAFAAPAAAQACDATTATPTSFADATSTSPLGSCITIEGIVVGRTLVEDSRARYRPEQRENDPSSSGAVLGLFSFQRFDVPTRVRVVGVLIDCGELIQATEARGERIGAGYCFHFHGRALSARVAVTTLEPAPLTRLTRADAGPDLGNLSPLPDGDVRRQMADAVTHFIIAVRSGDRAAVTTMHGGGAAGTRSPSELAATERLIFDDPASP
ncbi:MAG: hypothetical protein ABL874_00855, partial [Sphingopyxis sp.]